MNIFCQRLKEVRKENNLTQKQLASLLHTTDDSIFSWEKGRSQPSIELLQKICTELNVSSDYLIGLKDDME